MLKEQTESYKTIIREQPTKKKIGGERGGGSLGKRKVFSWEVFPKIAPTMDKLPQFCITFAKKVLLVIIAGEIS